MALMLAVAFALAAAAPSRAQQPPHWRVFTSSDGLRESWVEDVTLGSNGRVWVSHGAVDSLTVYDGYGFRRLPSPGASLKVREGPTGQVWTLLPSQSTPGAYSGLQLLDGQKWTAYPVAPATDQRIARRHFLPWAEDRVLILLPDALLEFDRARGSAQVICRAAETGLTRFTELAPANDGGAWVGGVGAVLHIPRPGRRGTHRTERTLPPAWRTSQVARIHHSDRRLFVSVGSGAASAAVVFDGTTWRQLLHTANGATAVEAWPGRGDESWLASVSPSGFRLRLQAGDCCGHEVDRTKGLSGRLNAVEPLPDGGFWLATSLGLVRHAPATWHSPPELASLDGPVGGLLEAKSGELYALQEGGLLRRKDGRWTLLRAPEQFFVDHGPATNLAQLRDGRILFGANAAGTRQDATLAFDPIRSQFTRVQHPEGRVVRMLGRAPGGTAWVATSERLQSRLERYDGHTFTPVADVQSAWASGKPRVVLELADGGVLIVPDGDGVGWVRQGRREVLRRAQGYPGSGSFAALQVDATHVWFGDRDSVLSFDGQRWRTVRAGLQTVRSIVRTSDGSIWVASGSGLHRYRGDTWTTVAAPEGLPDGSVHHLLEDRHGTIWVSTTVGLSRYAADADRDPPQTSLDIAGNPTEVPPSGNVHIAFSGRDRWNFSQPERLLYAWRVDGGAWSSPEPRNTVALEGLPAGRHRVEVRAADRNGNVDPSPAALEFRVLLPWYRETGFLAVGAVGSLALAVAIGLHLSRHARLERLVTERTAALAEVNTQLRRELADRQRMEQERTRLEGQLHQAQKLEAVGRLAGGIAHDFNNLLTVITGFADVLRDEVARVPTMRRAVDEIAKAAQRATALTRQVLAFSRQQVVEPTALDLNAVLTDIEPMLHRLIGEDITLSFRPAGHLGRVLADRGQIEQVIVNLAVNARDAMPAGGLLTFETSDVDLDDAFVRSHAGAAAGPQVLLTVTDTGIGMDADTRARAFEPFFSTKARDKGSGLGLATVYGIVAQAGGHIWVESEPGAGTSFRIYLPRTEGAGAAPKTEAAAAAVGGSERILLVEDDPAVQQVATTVLRRLGYDVEAVSSAEAALQRLREPVDAPDLVLTDIVLTGMSGLELVTRARQQRSNLRVLFMSGYADSALARKGPPIPGASFIQKPFTVEALSWKVREALESPSTLQ